MSGDDHPIERFRAAQDRGGIYDRALAELREGRKRSHWMWFVFPQIAGLGRSPTAVEFSLSGLAAARAYLGHPVLGPRLRECCEALLALPAGASAEEVFGGIDALKLRSSMTLFLRAAPAEPLFAAVLERLCGGEPDPLTDALLASAGS